MANNKKFRVNPFRFLLLRRMLDYEFMRIGETPNRSQLTEFIYNKHKSEPFKKTYYTSKVKDSLAYQRAERIRKYILTPSDFRYSEEMLDHLAKEISVIDKFSSWRDFLEKHGDHSCACKLDAIMEETNFDEIYELEKEKIKSQVFHYLYNLHLDNIRKQGETKHTILSEGEFTIRTIDAGEIKDIEQLALRLYPCPINKFDVKLPWFNKNPNIFFVYKDDYDLWGNINLLPIRDCAYRDLKDGIRYESELTAADIFTVQEKSQVNYIYVEGFACAVLKSFVQFSRVVDQMIGLLADLTNENLTICAIGGSDEGDRLMTKIGFEITGWAIDPKTNQQFPFYECKWSNLLSFLVEKDLLKPLIVSQRRLTPYSKK